MSCYLIDGKIVFAFFNDNFFEEKYCTKIDYNFCWNYGNKCCKIVAQEQCDQIMQNFANLAKF